MSRRGWLLFVALCVLWGMPYLFIRVAVAHVGPGTLVFLRTSIASVLLLPVALARRQLRPALAHWRGVLLFAFVEVMMPWVLLSDAERHLSSSLAGLMIAVVPLLGAVLALASPHGDRFGPLQLGGLLVGLVGAICLVGFDLGQLRLLAVLEMAGVAIGYAAGPVALARISDEVSGLGVISLALVMSALCVSPFAIAAPPRAVPAKAVASIVVLGVLCTALAFLLFFRLVAEIGPTRCTVMTYIQPAVAVLLGVALLGEHLTLGILVGFPLILVGSVLAARSRTGRVELPAEPAAVAAAGPG